MATPRRAERSGHDDDPEEARLRAQGLIPVTFWVPDVTTPEFAAEAHRQSLLAAQSPHAEEDMAWVDSHFDHLLDDISRSEPPS